jgi:HEPN domain-containing protein
MQFMARNLCQRMFLLSKKHGLIIGVLRQRLKRKSPLKGYCFMADQMTDLDSAREWLRFAQMDLGSAEYLLPMRPCPTEIICYHCQQSAEKALKSILVLNAVFPPRIHDLVELKALCVPFITKPETIDVECDHLTDYSVRPRYPQETEISDTQLQKAIEDAKTIFEYVKSFFPPGADTE